MLALLVSHSGGLEPEAQQQHERGLLRAAALGEIHLHVSAPVRSVVSRGVFEPRSADDSAEWRRSTGGRSVVCAPTDRIVTLALPHRSALVGSDRRTLRPEQVLNRSVRGLLAWLRARGIDASYPGLDVVTVGRRAVAHVSFVETAHGPTLFQAIVAGATALTCAVVKPPPPLAGATWDGSGTCLAELCGEASGDLEGPPTTAELARLVAAGYAAEFSAEVFELDPELASAPQTAAEAIGEASPLERSGAAPLGDRAGVTWGRLGPVWARLDLENGLVSGVSLDGSFIAPEGAVERLRVALIGRPATPVDLRLGAREVLDGNETYMLGLDLDALSELLQRAADARVRA